MEENEELQRRRVEMRRQMFTGVDLAEDHESFQHADDGQGAMRRVLRRAKAWLRSKAPLQEDMRGMRACTSRTAQLLLCL